MKLKVMAAALAAFLSISVQADSIRLADGVVCEFDADESNMDISVGAGRQKITNPYGYDDRFRSDDSGFGVQLTYRFGTPNRLDCGALFELELERRKLELELTRKKLALMDKAEEIEW